MLIKKKGPSIKKLLLSTKRKAWDSFCLNHNERFGFLFNLVFNRGSSENFIGVNPNNDPNNTTEDKINYLIGSFFPSPSSEDNLDYTPIIGHVEPMVIEDIEIVINALKGGKAPGLDRIDFRMWRAVFLHDKEFILDLINICFKFNYFPEHLRNTRVFFLLKDGKDPGLCTSYRPVCLLPTFGKVIERLFLLQLNKWLDRNNIIHHNQYGFREDSPHCICGMLGAADHYNFSSSLTKEFHLIKPAYEHEKAWFNNLLTNRQAVTKMEGSFRTSRNICDTLTQERDHN
ncbi:hypothetical protein AVEN_4057-1 [Araneus ventricosus]|uniref:Reverse transcriptase domain-containing protein n=1 Tax=Araneus ventricosus TaxID=182803 RepID=A0A4Y2MAH1_ARAVE|nr:hypothetical protein AVEN_4057-1 [Araneus ventricosus]